MGRLLHTCCGLGPAPHLPQSNPLSAVTSRFLLSRNLNPKSANNGALAPQWGDIETGGEGDDLKPQTTPPSPRVSKKKDPESRLFHLNYYACLRHPLGAYLNPTPGRPSGLAARNDGQGHRRISHLLVLDPQGSPHSAHQWLKQGACFTDEVLPTVSQYLLSVDTIRLRNRVVILGLLCF